MVEVHLIRNFATCRNYAVLGIFYTDLIECVSSFQSLDCDADKLNLQQPR